ncbi:efflux RND transporter periplasmic adaptor subunit [Hymenobacter ginsengisoli]|uniref:Efflux RND transporter periplasmic adaptor subunit n=1 Tax=Hymenobacter ginsengisoli TaxID=1051626 RepID=A0ABP8QLB8_9BACT|nr:MULTISPECIES: efflux RND transporter periplasmic adaptor subunit [unclassified Hymenobacter]MBO2029871.1 efflux RND transporter periplasmic adaptor subunit [Hymenobacter sp. BT559]
MTPSHFPFFFLLALSLLTGCGKKGADDDDHPTATQAADPPLAPNQVQLSENQVRAINLRLGRLTTQDVSNVVKATGTLSLPPQRRASVSAYQGGIIRALPVTEGQPVRQGQVLAELENPDFVQLQQDYLTQRDQFAFLEADYNRQKALLAEQVGVAKNVQQTAANYNAARATLRSLESRLTTLGIALGPLRAGRLVSRIPVKSPLAGRLRYQPGLAIGASVSPAGPLFEVLDTRRLFVELQVFEQDFGKVHVGQAVHVTLPSLPDRPATEALVAYIDPAFNPATKTVKVRAIIDHNHDEQLLPGLFVNAVIDVDPAAAPAAVATVPDAALVPEGESNYLYTLVSTRHEATGNEYVYEKHEVRTGAAARGFTAITPVDKLPANAQIVINGAYYLQAQQGKSSGGQGDDD